MSKRINVTGMLIIGLLLITLSLSYSQHIYAQGGTYSFTDPAVWLETNGYDPSKIANRVVSGDFNGDNRDDVAMMYDYGNDEATLHVFLSTGSGYTYQGNSGWWTSGIGNYDANRTTGRIVAGDFDGNGKDDIAAMYDYGNAEARFHIFLSTGSSFTLSGGADGWWNGSAGNYEASRATGHVAVGDFNGDGKDDITAMYAYDNEQSRLHVFQSTGSTFVVTEWWGSDIGDYDANRVTGRLVAGDFNGDKKDDVATMYDYGNAESRIHVFVSTGSSFESQNGGFTWWASEVNKYDANKTSYRFVANKFDGDNKDDIVLMYDYGSGLSRLHVFVSTGSSFTLSGGPFGWWESDTGSYNANRVTGRFVAGDFNKDGLADITTIFDNLDVYPPFQVFLAHYTPPPPTPTDTPTETPTNTPMPTDTFTPIRTDTSVPPTSTDIPTDVPTEIPPTETAIPPTGTVSATPIPTETAIPPTGTVSATPMPPTGTVSATPMPTETPIPPPHTATATATASPTSNVGTLTPTVTASPTNIADLAFEYQNSWLTFNGYLADRVTNRFVSGDFDGDGTDDVAAMYAYDNAETRIHVFLSTGSSFEVQNGGFGWWASSKGDYDANRVAGRVVAGDFNGDGRDDIAAMYAYDNAESRIHVFLSTGSSFEVQNGGFGWWASKIGNYDANRVTGRMVAGDFDGDGKDDVATMYEYDNAESRIHVFLSTGSSFEVQNGGQGWWQSGVGNYDANRAKYRMVSGDFDGDGKDDIATMYDYGNAESRIHVFLSTGSSFEVQNGGQGWWRVDAGNFDANLVSTRFVAGDFNNDRKDDISTFYNYWHNQPRAFVFLSTGGSFEFDNYKDHFGWWVAKSYNAYLTKGRFASGDFNQDGYSDIAMMYDYGNTSPQIHVLLTKEEPEFIEPSEPPVYYPTLTPTPTPTPTRPDGYRLPWPGGQNNRVNQGNGGNGGKDDSHRWGTSSQWGFDFSTTGDIVASRAGRVIGLEWQRDRSCYNWGTRSCSRWCANEGSNFVRILHDDNTSSLYLHFAYNSLTVANGSYVQAGQVIGRAGTTGCSTGVHLHFQRNYEYWKYNSIPTSFLDVHSDGGVPKSYRWYTSDNYLISSRQAKQVVTPTEDIRPPFGGVEILTTGQPTHTVTLHAVDYESNSVQMRLAKTEDSLATATWQPITYTATVDWLSPQVFVEFQDEVGNSAIFSDTLPVEVFEEITPKFTVEAGCTGQQLNLVNETTPYCEHCSWHWDLGNDVTSQAIEPQQEFIGEYPIFSMPTTGTHVITLTVSNASSTKIYTQEVVSLLTPSAGFTITQLADNMVSVIAEDSEAQDWLWTFNNSITMTGRTVSYAYTSTTAMTNHPIQLLVTDDNGCRNSDYQFVEVTESNANKVYLPVIVK